MRVLPQGPKNNNRQACTARWSCVSLTTHDSTYSRFTIRLTHASTLSKVNAVSKPSLTQNHVAYGLRRTAEITKYESQSRIVNSRLVGEQTNVDDCGKREEVKIRRPNHRRENHEITNHESRITNREIVDDSRTRKQRPHRRFEIVNTSTLVTSGSHTFCSDTDDWCHLCSQPTIVSHLTAERERTSSICTKQAVRA